MRSRYVPMVVWMTLMAIASIAVAWVMLYLRSKAAAAEPPASPVPAAPGRRPFRPTPVRKKPSLDFSVTGLIYCSLMMFMGLAAMNSQANLLFAVFGLMIGVLLVSLAISRVVLRRLDVRRLMPEHAIVGQPAVLTYELTNRKRYWPSLSVSLTELDGCESFTRQPFAYMLHAAPRTTAIVSTEIVPRRRGVHVLERYQVSTSFPFGFIKRAITRREHDTILVFPAVAEVDSRLLALCRSAEKSGSRMRPQGGGQDEFFGVKQFRHGDSPRLIHWRRSARTGVLVTKEMTRVSPPRLMLLVDTFVSESPDGAGVADQLAGVERCIAMAGSVATFALQAGLSVGLAAWSGDWVVVPPNAGKRHARDLLAVLARLPRNTSQNADALIDEAYEVVRSGTTPMLITPRDVPSSSPDRGGRAGLVVLSAATSDFYFHFPPDLDFAHAMPPEQEPKIGGVRG